MALSSDIEHGHEPSRVRALRGPLVRADRIGLDHPRTIQFLIKRFCPNHSQKSSGKTPVLAGYPQPKFPLVLFVDWPPEKLVSYDCSKSKWVYHVSDHSAAEIGLSRRNIYVCDCMGSLIE